MNTQCEIATWIIQMNFKNLRSLLLSNCQYLYCIWISNTFIGLDEYQHLCYLVTFLAFLLESFHILPWFRAFFFLQNTVIAVLVLYAYVGYIYVQCFWSTAWWLPSGDRRGVFICADSYCIPSFGSWWKGFSWGAQFLTGGGERIVITDCIWYTWIAGVSFYLFVFCSCTGLSWVIIYKEIVGQSPK